MIYFSFIGNHDKIEGGSVGAAVTIFLRYKTEIDKIYFLVTPSNSPVNYEEIAKQNIKFIQAENPEIEIELVHFNIDNPVDFDLVYPKLLDIIQSIVEKNDLDDRNKIINITSGTPTMTTCFVLLQQSGLISNAKLIQSFESKYASSRGSSTQEVNLEIDDFPNITSPDSLKRKLTIKNRENIKLSEKVKKNEIDEKFPYLIGKSKKIYEIKDQIFYDINNQTHVLIMGERGTGKEVVAESIWSHYSDDKKDNELLTFNCGAFTPNLIMSELFGYKKGAFTGADKDKKGIILQAKNRMLFLDEIGNMPKEGQQALLRFMMNGKFRPIGSSDMIELNTQIIAATNKDINNSSIFAQDLKDRFDEFIELPPLSERKEDIPLLINHFINQCHFKHPVILDDEIMEQLHSYNWPGNVRELKKWIERLSRRFPKGGHISASDLPDRYIEKFTKEKEELELPDLPLPIPLNEYINKIREKARKMSNGVSANVDRLLKQNLGTEKQRQYRKKKE